MSADTPLVLVSNRGPVTFQEGGEIKRGTGGLVTALIGLASHRPVTWVASAMTDEDVAEAQRNDGRPFPVKTPEGDEYRVKLVASDPDAYDGFYNIIANPLLWFIQHYLWDLSNAPDIRRNETEAYEFGYNAVNEDLAHAVLEEIDGVEKPVVMVHDYHLYVLPALIRRRAARRRSCTTSSTSRGASRTPGACFRRRSGDDIYNGILSNDIIGFHTRSYRRNFLQCCEDLMGLEVDHEAGVVTVRRPRGVGPRLPAADRLDARSRRSPRRPRVREFEAELLRRRRDHLILRVDRADLSKNVLRGFSAFDTFLEQHPEFRERVTFIAQLMPSRTDVPEYAEYLERIEAVVAVVNHRHGSPDWMPIQLKLRDDLEEAVAAYKHYDMLMVNAMFDGMNLVAKEGPMVNERAGVSMLSENTGAHEELGRVRAVGQPVRHPGAGRLHPRRADDAHRGAQAPSRGPHLDRHRAQPRRLDRRPARRHPGQGSQAGERGLASPRARAGSVEGAALAQKLHVGGDPPLAALFGLDVVQAVEERVALLALEGREELAGPLARRPGLLEVIGDRGAALGLVGGLPAAVGLSGLDLCVSGGAHPAVRGEGRAPSRG